MAKKVDPYYQWLGIPPKDQPPNHYRLLGLELFEANRDVIDAAANRQMSFIKQYQTGEDADLTQKLLNELSAARLCLLSPTVKAAYDQQLRAKLEARSASATPVPNSSAVGERRPNDSPSPATDGFAPLSHPKVAVPARPGSFPAPASPRGEPPRRAGSSSTFDQSKVLLGALVAMPLVLAGLLAFVLFLPSNSKPESGNGNGTESRQEELTGIENFKSPATEPVAGPAPAKASLPTVVEPAQAAQPAASSTRPPVSPPKVEPPRDAPPSLLVQTPPDPKPKETLEQAERRLRIAAERASSPAEHRAVAQESLAIANKALLNSQPELTKRIAERALAAARKSGSDELVRQATLFWSRLE